VSKASLMADWSATWRTWWNNEYHKIPRQPAATDGSERVGPNDKRWGWWRQDMQKLRDLSADYWRELVAKHPPNGEWPWWFYGPEPGDPDCLMHPDVLAENGFVEQYNANGAKK
jgi:hypothetical protein